MRTRRAFLALTALALVAVALYASTRQSDPAAVPVRTPEAVGGVVVATPGGVALPTVMPERTTAPTPAATATPAVTPAPVATAAPTAAATLAPTPTPFVAMETPAGTPATLGVGVAPDPAGAVLSFYQAVTAGDFDAAYALWDERMRATYPREPNLDSRFDETAEITFSQLSVAEMSGGSATVQANFTETAESGASRQFIGYWRLVLVDGRWLLDEPHY